MTEKTSWVTKIFNKLHSDNVIYDFSKDISVPETVTEKKDIQKYIKDEEQQIKDIVKDFPLLLKIDGTTGVKIKRSETLTDIQLLINKLETCNAQKTYYSDKIRFSSSKTIYPFNSPDIKPNYLNSAILSKDEKIDFCGNAAYSQYYALITRMITNNGKYLKDDYVLSDLPLEIQKRIKEIEKWYRDSKNNVVEPFIDDHAAQILFPIDNGTYISITPSESLPMIKKVIAVSQKISNKNFLERKQLKSDIDKISKKINSLKAKNTTILKKKTKTKKGLIEIVYDKEKCKELKIENFIEIIIQNSNNQKNINDYIDNTLQLKELHEELEVLKERLKNVPILKKTTWQQMISKVQNISKNAPASKNGIFLAEAQNLDKSFSRELSAKHSLINYVKKNLNHLFYKSKTFQEMSLKIFKNLLIYVNKDKDMNADEKQRLNNSIANSFKYFLSQDKVIDDICTRYSLEKIVEEFLFHFLLLSEKEIVLSPLATAHFEEILFNEGEVYVSNR